MHRRVFRGMRGSLSRPAFTLVELLVAVTLLVLIMLATTYVFSTSTEAISETQGDTETTVRLSTFAETFRRDISRIEHQGCLVMGARQQQAYGNHRQQEVERKSTFRNDWLMFLTNAESEGGIDGRVFGQASKVFYGHGRTTDPQGWYFQDRTYSEPLVAGLSVYSQFATDWALMRHELLMVHQLRTSGATWEGIEVAGTIGQYSLGALYDRDIRNQAARQFRWGWWQNGQFLGSVTVDYGHPGSATGRLAIYEPLYYHYANFYGMPVDARNFRALSHCSAFRIQYAMAADLRAGPDGGVRWRDPPPDPPLDEPTADQSAGDANRLLFAPGDAWPVIIKCMVEVWDPLERIAEGKTLSIVCRVP
ncbi:MAG: hypothetical protein PHU85_04205 [Phycisphaerae bacterium]|nr:hypothetical protein [Phycisphaerae bacterium]